MEKIFDGQRNDLTLSQITGILVTFNSLPNDKFWDLSKLKAFADDKINVT